MVCSACTVQLYVPIYGIYLLNMRFFLLLILSSLFLRDTVHNYFSLRRTTHYNDGVCPNSVPDLLQRMGTPFLNILPLQLLSTLPSLAIQVNAKLETGTRPALLALRALAKALLPLPQPAKYVSYARARALCPKPAVRPEQLVPPTHISQSSSMISATVQTDDCMLLPVIVEKAAVAGSKRCRYSACSTTRPAARGIVARAPMPVCSEARQEAATVPSGGVLVAGTEGALVVFEHARSWKWMALLRIATLSECGRYLKSTGGGMMGRLSLCEHYRGRGGMRRCAW
jgi:hypothetical protein